MTPYEVASAVLTLSASLVHDAPTRRYVAAGKAQPWRCEQVVVKVDSLRPSGQANAVARQIPTGCFDFNLLHLCVEVVRCYPTIKDRSAPPVADIQTASAIVMDDGLKLYLGLTTVAIEDVLSDCTVVTGPDVEWSDPRGGWQSTTACFSVSFAPSSLGS